MSASRQMSRKARMNASPSAAGTVLRFRWVTFCLNSKKPWVSARPIAVRIHWTMAREHSRNEHHSPRVRMSPRTRRDRVKEIVVLHFQYAAWDLECLQHRWYQLGNISTQQKGPLQIFRNITTCTGVWDKKRFHPVTPEWLEGTPRWNRFSLFAERGRLPGGIRNATHASRTRRERFRN